MCMFVDVFAYRKETNELLNSCSSTKLGDFCGSGDNYDDDGGSNSECFMWCAPPSHVPDTSTSVSNVMAFNHFLDIWLVQLKFIQNDIYLN